MRGGTVTLLTSVLGGPVLHHLGEGGVLEDPFIVDATCPAGQEVHEACMVFDNALQHGREETLLLDELYGVLGRAEAGDGSVIDGGPHSAEARDDLQ